MPSWDFQKILDRLTPGAAKAKLGTTLVDIITQYNLLRADRDALLTRLKNCLLGSAGLAIKAGASPTVKAANAFSAIANGTVVYKAANTDMAALAGTLATAKAAAWAFYIDSDGTLTASAKTADAADAAAAIALLPAIPANTAQIGYVVIANATGADFVGGATALDTASLTVTYVNTAGIVGDAGLAGAAALAALGDR